MFLLSIQQPYLDWILSGSKRWEFRENPAFGNAGDHKLAPGDVLFLVDVGSRAAIVGVCRAARILRGEEMVEYFQDPTNGHWTEGGFAEGTARDWAMFQREIIGVYRVAIELTDVSRLSNPIALASVRQRYTGRPWTGRGFCHVSQLHRYAVEGEELSQVLTR